MFERKGVIIVSAEKYKEDQIFEMIVDAEPDNIETDDGEIIITAAPDKFETIRKILEDNKIEIINSNIEFIAKNKADVDAETVKKVASLYEKLDDHDDVQNVYVNVDLPEE